MTIKSSNPSIRDLPSPGKDLLDTVKAGFVLQGKTMAGWCREHAICRINARNALTGNRNGPKAAALRLQLVEASKALSLMAKA